MQKEIDLIVSPEEAAKEDLLKALVSEKAGIPVSDIQQLYILKRSIDARKRNVRINLRVIISIHEPYDPQLPGLPDYPNVSSEEEILIIGAGPAGLFAALRAIELGKKPVILERGKCVKD
ncbi:NAD(P)/FAD-dependent oxidoreductase, partial [Balneolaceae bacterium ANBcel3]|nr:NAD(P)/FAD-dependent oxidoreductase [Balneolaceae bacterium ANBcel3]